MTDSLATARRRVRPVVVVSALVAALLLIGVGWAWRVASARVADPDMSLPDHADALLVFFGGEERVPFAAGLVDSGIADTLVINHGLKDGRLAEDLSPLCDDPSLAYEVVCIVAEPSDTAGEARVFSELAVERGWSSVVVVTSDFHVERARFHLEQCFDGDIHAQGVDTGTSRSERRETLKLLVAWIIGRGC